MFVPVRSATDWRYLVKAFLLAALILTIAACGRRSAPDVAAETPANVEFETSFRQTFCPRVNLRRRTQGYPVYQSGFDLDPQYLLYQGAIRRTARECNYLDNRVIMRVGVSGRVLRGPADAGSISATLPIRVVVVDGTGSPRYSELRNVAVELPAGSASTAFSMVQENVAVDLGPDDNARDLSVIVGFDRQADEL